MLAPAPPAWGLSGAAPDEPLAAGRVRADDLRGRGVYAFDETRVGTLVAAADAVLFALDPRLGLGRECVAAPLGRVRVATAERRLVLDMTPREFQAALVVRIACGI